MDLHGDGCEIGQGSGERPVTEEENAPSSFEFLVCLLAAHQGRGFLFVSTLGRTLAETALLTSLSWY